MSIHFDPAHPSSTSQVISFSGAHHEAPVGLASTPSTLQHNPRLEANGFFDTIVEWFQSLLGNLLPCFFEEKLSASFLDRRVSVGKQYLENTFQPLTPDGSQGIDGTLMNDSKAVIIIKYNGMTEVVYRQLNGFGSLQALQRSAIQKMEELVRHPGNASAHRATLSISADMYHAHSVALGIVHYYGCTTTNYSFAFDTANNMQTTPSPNHHAIHQTEPTIMYHLRQEIPSSDTVDALHRFLYS